MATTWDRIQTKRDKLYKIMLPAARMRPLVILDEELQNALLKGDQAHIYAVKDVSIILFVEAQSCFKKDQIKYAEMFDTLHKRCQHRGEKQPEWGYLEFAGFFEALYGSLIVMSTFTPEQDDLEFLAQSESCKKTLELLRWNRVISASLVGKELSLTTQSGFKILKKLEARKLIRPIEKTGRTQLYSLTSEGNKLIAFILLEKDI